MSNEQDIVWKYDQDMSDILAVDSAVKRRIGNMCYVSSLPADRDGFIEIGIFTDELIMDSREERPKIRLVNHDNVFRAYFENQNTGTIIVFPNRNEIHNNVKKYMSRSTEKYETNLLDSAGSRILKINQVMNQINPIVEIINSVLHFSNVTKKEFKWGDVKTERYMDFLEDLDIISIDGNRVLPGVVMNSRMDSRLDKDQICEDIITEVVNKGMITMMYSLKMTHLQSFMKLSNANYMTSFVAESILNWDCKSYSYYLKKIYNMDVTRIKILNSASSLRKVDVLQENDYGNEPIFSCNEELFDKYSKKCKQTVFY